METTQLLLYNLNIPFSYFDTLRDYYYIPEGKHEGLLENGHLLLYTRGEYEKRVVFKGTLKRYKERKFMSYIGFHNTHVFYKPRLTKMQRLMLALNTGFERGQIVVNS